MGSGSGSVASKIVTFAFARAPCQSYWTVSPSIPKFQFPIIVTTPVALLTANVPHGGVIGVPFRDQVDDRICPCIRLLDCEAFVYATVSQPLFNGAPLMVFANSVWTAGFRISILPSK